MQNKGIRIGKPKRAVQNDFSKFMAHSGLQKLKSAHLINEFGRFELSKNLKLVRFEFLKNTDFLFLSSILTKTICQCF